MEQVSGYINHIVYANAETGYAVIEIVKDGEEMTLVGIMPQISEGEYIQAEGNRITHAVYGEQFSVTGFSIQAPEECAPAHCVRLLRSAWQARAEPPGSRQK